MAAHRTTSGRPAWARTPHPDRVGHRARRTRTPGPVDTASDRRPPLQPTLCSGGERTSQRDLQLLKIVDRFEARSTVDRDIGRRARCETDSFVPAHRHDDILTALGSVDSRASASARRAHAGAPGNEASAMVWRQCLPARYTGNSVSREAAAGARRPFRRPPGRPIRAPSRSALFTPNPATRGASPAGGALEQYVAGRRPHAMTRSLVAGGRTGGGDHDIDRTQGRSASGSRVLVPVTRIARTDTGLCSRVSAARATRPSATATPSRLRTAEGTRPTAAIEDSDIGPTPAASTR